MHSSKTVKLKITMTGETLLTKRVVEKPKTAGTVIITENSPVRDFGMITGKGR